MPRGMKGNCDPVAGDAVPVGEGFNMRAGAEAFLENFVAGPGGEIIPRAAPGVVGMCVGNDGKVHRLPGVDIKITRGAIKTVFGDLQQQHPASRETQI